MQHYSQPWGTILWNTILSLEVQYSLQTILEYPCGIILYNTILDLGAQYSLHNIVQYYSGLFLYYSGNIHVAKYCATLFSTLGHIILFILFSATSSTRTSSVQYCAILFSTFATLFFSTSWGPALHNIVRLSLLLFLWVLKGYSKDRNTRMWVQLNITQLCLIHRTKCNKGQGADAIIMVD